MNFIHRSAKLGSNCTVGHFSVIEEGVIIGDNVSIGNNVTIHSDTLIGSGNNIADGCIVGKWPKPAKSSTAKLDSKLPALTIGNNCNIGSQTIIYRGSNLGENVTLGDQAFIREKVIIKDNVVIGRGVSVENQVSICANTKIQTNAYITAYTVLEENVFIAPGVITTNDNLMGRTEERFKHISGPIIKKGARVGGGSVLLPGVKVAEESFIAAGALINKDTETAKVYVGVPGKILREVPENEKIT